MAHDSIRRLREAAGSNPVLLFNLVGEEIRIS
jgi:hypothetical protein